MNWKDVFTLIKITPNNYTHKNVLLVCILATIILAAILIYNLVITSKYEKTEATIINIQTETFEGDADSGSSRAHFITYRFIYKGESYEVTKQVMTIIGRHEGDPAVLRFDPKNPERVLDSFLILYCSVGIPILLLMMFILIRYPVNSWTR